MASTQIKDGFNGGSDNQAKVDSQGRLYVYDAGGGTGSNASVGPNGSTAPTSSTEIAGINPEGNLTPVSVTDSGAINVVTSGTSTVSGTVVSETAGLNSFQTSQYTIGTTAVHLAPTPLANRSSISITITASAGVPVFIGNSAAVTITTGYPLYNGSTIQLDLTPTGNVYAISTTAGQTASVLEIA
jgi:hypothetical protein